MPKFIDINDRGLLHNRLILLQPDTAALWGKMTPQQMVEHLIEQVRYTNGKYLPTCDRPADEAERAKQRAIYTDIELPRNIVLGELPPNYTYPDLSTAITQLMQELDCFDVHFATPGRIEIHGGFGPMNHQEWLIWHGKHFTHHLKQFGLI